MTEIASAYVQIIPSFKGAQAQIASEMRTRGTAAAAAFNGSFATRLGAAGAGISKFGRTLTTRVSLGAAAAGGAMLMMAGNFEQGMNRVRALTHASGTDFTKLREQAKTLGATTKFSAGQAADAMGFLAQAGFKTTDIFKAMPSTLNLAAAANIDLGRAADITSNVLTGYGMKVENLAHANDVLVKAFTSSNIDLNMLGESFKYAGPIAKATGLSFEDAAASIGMLGNAGIQGSMAGTTLRGALARLANPSRQVQKTLSKLGVAVSDSTGKMRPFIDIVGDLASAGADAGDIMQIFGKNAGPGMQALVDQGAPAIRKLSEALKDSGGTAEYVAKEQMRGFKGGLTEMKSAFEGLMIAVGDSGALAVATSLIRSLTSGIRALSQASPGVLKAFTGIGAGVSVLGPVLWGVGKAMTVISGLMSAVSSGGTALAAVFTALTGPVGLTVAGIAALGAGMVAAYHYSETFRNGVHALWEAVKSGFSYMIQSLQGPMSTAWGQLLGVWDSVKAAGVALWEALSAAYNTAFKPIVDGIVANWSAISANLAGVWNGLVKIFSGAWTAITAVLSGALKVITGVVNVFTGVFTGDWSKAWNGVKQIFSGAWTAISGIFRGVTTVLVGVLKVFGSSVRNLFTVTWSAVKGVTIAAWNAIKSRLSSAWNSIKSLMSSVWNGIKNTLTSAWNSIRNGVSNGVNGMISVVAGIPRRVLGALGNLGSLLYNSGVAMLNGLARGIANGVSRAISAVKNGLRAIRSYFPFSPAKRGPFSGRGWVYYSGESIGSTFMKSTANAMVGNLGLLDGAMSKASDSLTMPIRRIPSGGAGYSDNSVSPRLPEARGVTVNQYIQTAEVPKDSRLASAGAEQARMIGVLS